MRTTAPHPCPHQGDPIRVPPKPEGCAQRPHHRQARTSVYVHTFGNEHARDSARREEKGDLSEQFASPCCSSMKHRSSTVQSLGRADGAGRSLYADSHSLRPSLPISSRIPSRSRVARSDESEVSSTEADLSCERWLPPKARCSWALTAPRSCPAPARVHLISTRAWAASILLCTRTRHARVHQARPKGDRRRHKVSETARAPARAHEAGHELVVLHKSKSPSIHKSNGPRMHQHHSVAHATSALSCQARGPAEAARRRLGGGQRLAGCWHAPGTSSRQPLGAPRPRWPSSVPASVLPPSCHQHRLPPSRFVSLPHRHAERGSEQAARPHSSWHWGCLDPSASGVATGFRLLGSRLPTIKLYALIWLTSR